MSDLIALVLDSREQAQEARLEFMKMQREHLVELEDCVVAYKDDTGQVKLDQTLNLTATGAAAGALAHHYRRVRRGVRGVIGLAGGLRDRRRHDARTQRRSGPEQGGAVRPRPQSHDG